MERYGPDRLGISRSSSTLYEKLCKLPTLYEKLCKLGQGGRDAVDVSKLTFGKGELAALITCLDNSGSPAPPIALQNINATGQSLVLSHHEFHRPLCLTFTHLPTHFNLERSQLPALRITVSDRCTIGCEFNMQGVRLDGNLTLEFGCHPTLGEPTSALAKKTESVASSLNLQSAYIGGDLMLYRCVLGSNPSRASRKLKPLDGDHLHVEGRLIVTMCKMSGMVRLCNAWIGGSVRFKQTELINPGHAAFFADRIEIKADFLMRDKVTVRGQFCMVNATVAGEMDLRGTSFIFGPTAFPEDFQKSIIVCAELKKICWKSTINTHPLASGEALMLYRLSVGGSLRFGKFSTSDTCTLLGIQRVATGCVNLQSANIRGHLAIEGASFEAAERVDQISSEWDYLLPSCLIIDDAKIGGNVRFVNCKVTGVIRFAGAVISGNMLFRCVNVVSTHVAIFGVRSHIHGSLRFEGNQSHRLDIKGIVDLSGCEIGSFVDFSHADITGALACPVPDPKVGAVYGQHVSLVMTEAVIKRRLCLGHDVSGGTTAIEPTHWIDSTFIGCVSLVGIRVEGDLYCTGASFQSIPKPSEESDKDKKDWKRNSKLFRALDLTRAEIKGRLVWQVPKLKSSDHMCKMPKTLIPAGQIHYTQAWVGSLLDDKCCWPVDDTLFIDGFTFRQLDPDTHNISTRDRIEWLGKQPRGKQSFSLQAYDQLALVYRRMGTEEPIKLVGEAKQWAMVNRWTVAATPQAETQNYSHVRRFTKDFLGLFTYIPLTVFISVQRWLKRFEKRKSNEAEKLEEEDNESERARQIEMIQSQLSMLGKQILLWLSGVGYRPARTFIILL